MRKLGAILTLTALLSTGSMFGKSLFNDKNSVYKFRRDNSSSINYGIAPYRYECNSKWVKGKSYYGDHVWSVRLIDNCLPGENSSCDDAVLGDRFCEEKNGHGWYIAKIKNGQKGFESYDKKEWISVREAELRQEKARLRFEPFRIEWLEKENRKADKNKNKNHCN
jgi:hypothetical protein